MGSVLAGHGDMGQLRLDDFWAERLRPGAGDTLAECAEDAGVLPADRSRQRVALHRQWYVQSAMGDLLGEEFGLVQDDKLYRCLDKLTEHKEDLFAFLQKRWRDLFKADFEILLYDLTSTYFECEPPEEGKRKFGYSRDKRSDCVQVVIALIVTPEGFPLAYEVLHGNTSDKTTLRDFLKKIETRYGKAKRIWVMDRGIPTEDVLGEMRAAEGPVSYLWAHRADADAAGKDIPGQALGECPGQRPGQARRAGWRTLCAGA